MPAPRSKFHLPTWYQQVAAPCQADPLDAALDCDVLVIGAGLAGLSVARGLLERGTEELVVLDAGEPGEGASGRNGGFVFAGYSLDNLALIAQLGSEQARRLHGWTREAVGLIRSRCREAGVSVDESGVLLADWFGDDRRLARFRDQMESQLGWPLEWIPRTRMQEYVVSARYGAGLLEPGSFHFNPLAYCRAMTHWLRDHGARIHGLTPVTGLARSDRRWMAVTPAGPVRARQVILATGGYEGSLLPPITSAVQPIATYVLVTEPLGRELDEMLPGSVAVYDTRFAFDYFRPVADQRLLWGGRISIRDLAAVPIRKRLWRDLLRVFPALAGRDAEYCWGGWMSYARHQMPILADAGQGLWVAIGFGGHGMATTTLAGEVIAEALTGNPQRLAAFRRWPVTWAGGAAGRLAVQGGYLMRTLKDRIRDWRGAPRPARV